MQKTKIEWTNYTINPIKGMCKNRCFYCYACSMYKRFKWAEDIYLKLYALERIAEIKKPSKIFICSTHEILGKWIPSDWIKYIFDKCKQYPQHTFQFLTKNPKRLYLEKWHDLPDNFWMGTTVTCKGNAINIIHLLSWRECCSPNTTTFISFEPLMDDIDLYYSFKFVDWVIIGAMTGNLSKKYQPRIEWIENIIDNADRHNIPVFMKNNLKSVWNGQLRQEFP